MLIYHEKCFHVLDIKVTKTSNQLIPNYILQTCKCADIGFGSVDEILLSKMCDHKKGLSSREILHTEDMILKALHFINEPVKDF